MITIKNSELNRNWGSYFVHDPKEPESKPQISSTQLQINPKSQYLNVCNFGYCNLFVICNLIFGINLMGWEKSTPEWRID